MSSRRPPPRGSRLTAHERRLVELACEGLTYRDMAARVGSSVSSIGNAFSSIYNKSGCNSGAQLGAWAVRKGLVEGAE